MEQVEDIPDLKFGITQGTNNAVYIKTELHEELQIKEDTDREVYTQSSIINCIEDVVHSSSTCDNTEPMNSVKFLLKNRPLSYKDKIRIKELGPPTPDLTLKKTCVGKIRDFNRYFKRQNAYDRFSWMCGCSELNKMFCFVCLLSSDLKSSAWVTEGVNDLKHLQDRANKHGKSASHLDHLVDFTLLGKPNIRQQLNGAYRESIQAHNEKVYRNRHILLRLIMCIKFCGSFELALKESENENPGIFGGLVNFTSNLDSVLSGHLEGATIFKETSKTIQNELLDAMLKVCRTEIVTQIKSARFVAIEVDDTTDSFNQQQLVLIFRYVFEGRVVERFWGFLRPQGYTATDISNVILKEIKDIVPDNKLIAQSYDGVSVLSGVQTLVQEKYRYGFYVHCYAHEFNLILETAASACDKKMKVFFAEVQAFASFFSYSTKRTSLLDEVLKKRFPRAVPDWNFKTRTINTLFEKKELIRECLETIIDKERDSKTISEANGLLKNLNSEDFNFFVEVTHYITPHVENFFNKVQSRGANSKYVQTCLEEFEKRIGIVRERKINEKEDDLEQNRKRPKLDNPESNKIIANNYCEIIINQIKDKFNFTGHLSAVTLLSTDLFPTYKNNFPEEILTETVTSYPFLDKNKLKTELSVLFKRNDMHCRDILQLLNFIIKNNLSEGFSELRKLLDIICTTPFTTCEYEPERCFSTLKRVQTFLRNTMAQERLNALAMLSIEKKLVHSIADFDNKVVKVFCDAKERRVDFNYK